MHLQKKDLLYPVEEVFAVASRNVFLLVINFLQFL